MAVRGNARRTVPWWKQQRTQVIAAVVAVVIVLGAAAAIALGGGDDEPTAGGTTTTERTAKPGPGGPIAPLTGVVDLTGDSAKRASMTVKIDNVNLERRPPQAGLDQADVVYEEPVEGNATRFAAMFHSQVPNRVGPVRSTRFIDPAIVWPLPGSMYVYSGGTEDKVAAIEEAPVVTLDENGLVARNARVRDANFRAPHNLFAIPLALWASAEDTNPPAPLFLYGKATQDGDPAGIVDVPNGSRAHYEWDAPSRTWKRSELLGGTDDTIQPHVTEAGTQIAPTNVIVQRINGLERKEELLGEGDAWVFTNGRVMQGRWQRPALEDRTVFVDASGREIRLQPGTTWVHLITQGEPSISAAAP